jgi:AraC-like DNA-binding protein
VAEQPPTVMVIDDDPGVLASIGGLSGQLTRRRAEVAKEKLRDERLSLADVATECGFADQSHFTHHFTRLVGVAPRDWRRALKE